MFWIYLILMLPQYDLNYIHWLVRWTIFPQWLVFNIISHTVKSWSFFTRIHTVDLRRNLQNFLVEVIQVILLQYLVDSVVNRSKKLDVWWSSFLLCHGLSLLQHVINDFQFVWVNKDFCLLLEAHLFVANEDLIWNWLLSRLIIIIWVGDLIDVC